MHASPEDEELLDRWRTGDQQAGEVLFRRYYASIERFFASKSVTATADLVQETFTGCIEGRHRIKDGQRFRSYLFATAYYVLCGYLRTRNRRDTTVPIDELSMRDLSPSPSAIASARDEERLLLEALRTLSLKHQVVLELHYWESLTTLEIAEILDIAPGTAKSRLIRARAALSDTLERIANTPQLLHTTLTDLDRWAASCHRLLRGE